MLRKKIGPDFPAMGHGQRLCSVYALTIADLARKVPAASIIPSYLNNDRSVPKAG